jgi:hypothetical protein
MVVAFALARPQVRTSMQVSGLASYPTPTALKPGGSANSNAASNSASSLASDGGLGAGSVEQEFLKFAKMSPLDRLRANILRDMGLNEDDLKSLSPAERSAVEQKIKQLIEEQLQKSDAKPGQLMDVSA